MSELEFLGLVDGVPARSPLERALAPAGPHLAIRDLSLELGKIEVRGALNGELQGEVVRITPERALVLCNTSEAEAVRARAREQGLLAIDMTGALAGLEVRGEQLMRRLTYLDLDALPAVGSVAHVPATVTREGETFRIFFPQEYGHYVAEVVVDTAEGLSR